MTALLPPMEFDDLDDFLGDFGMLVMLPGKAKPVRIIIEEQYLSAELGTFDPNLSEPWGTLKSTDAAGMKKRDVFTVAGIKFWLTKDPEPDGTGFSVLRLSRSAVA